MNPNRNTILIVVLLLVAVFGAVYYADRHEDRPQTALGRAADDVGEGLKDAGDELSGKRTTSDKIGDAIQDVGRDIKRD